MREGWGELGAPHLAQQQSKLWGLQTFSGGGTYIQDRYVGRDSNRSVSA